MAGEGKVLAQGVPLETVIGKDAAQVWMAGKGNAEQVPDFPLEPSGRREDARGGRNRGVGVGPHLDHEPLVLGRAEKLVDHFETGIALRIINPANIDQHLELASAVVAQEVQDPDDGVLVNGEDELPFFLARGQNMVGHGRH